MTSLLNKLYNLFKIFYRWFYKTQTLHGCKKSITKQEAIKHQFPFPIVRQREGEGDTRPRPTSNHISLSVSHFFLCVKSTLRVGWLAFIFFLSYPTSSLVALTSHTKYQKYSLSFVVFPLHRFSYSSATHFRVPSKASFSGPNSFFSFHGYVYIAHSFFVYYVQYYISIRGSNTFRFLFVLIRFCFLRLEANILALIGRPIIFALISLDTFGDSELRFSMFPTLVQLPCILYLVLGSFLLRVIYKNAFVNFFQLLR